VCTIILVPGLCCSFSCFSCFFLCLLWVYFFFFFFGAGSLFFKNRKLDECKALRVNFTKTTKGSAPYYLVKGKKAKRQKHKNYFRPTKMSAYLIFLTVTYTVGDISVLWILGHIAMIYYQWHKGGRLAYTVEEKRDTFMLSIAAFAWLCLICTDVSGIDFHSAPSCVCSIVSIFIVSIVSSFLLVQSLLRLSVFIFPSNDDDKSEPLLKPESTIDEEVGRSICSI
jgi:hypothetical protein